MAIDVSTTLGGVLCPSCVMNAAGARSSTLQELQELATSEAGAVVLKSTTVQPVTEQQPHLQSLYNPGYREFMAVVPSLRQLGKPIIASLAGFAIADYAEMTAAYVAAGVDIVELNLADPYVVCNTSGSCDPAVVRTILTQVKACNGTTPLAAKLPAFAQRESMQEVLQMLRAMAIPIVICLNAPLGTPSQPVTPMVTHVQLACEIGQGAYDVIAVGGVKDGQGVYQALQQGAAAVQIGSALYQEGPGLFTRLHGELAPLLTQGGYASVQALRRR